MHALAIARALSANELFKRQYNGTLRWSVLGAVLVLVLAVVLLPEYRPVPYRLAQDSTRIVEIEVEAPPIAPPDDLTVPRPPGEVEPVPDDDPRAQELPDLIDIMVPLPPTVWDQPVPDAPFVPKSAKPQLVRGAVAEYPEMARLAGLQGTVMVRVLVDVDGTVVRVDLLKGVHPLLDRPALAAARKLVFTPGKQAEMPVQCLVAVPFRFFLR